MATWPWGAWEVSRGPGRGPDGPSSVSMRRPHSRGLRRVASVREAGVGQHGSLRVGHPLGLFGIGARLSDAMDMAILIDKARQDARRYEFTGPDGRICRWRIGDPYQVCDCGAWPRHGVQTEWRVDEATGVELLWDHYAWVGRLKDADIMSQGQTPMEAIRATISAAVLWIKVVREDNARGRSPEA